MEDDAEATFLVEGVEDSVLVRTIASNGDPNGKVVRIKRAPPHGPPVVLMMCSGFAFALAAAALLIVLLLLRDVRELIRLTNINSDTLTCGQNETLLHPTRLPTGQILGGACSPELNISLPKINPGSLVCPGAEIAVTQTVLDTGLDLDPFCILLPTGNLSVLGTDHQITVTPDPPDTLILSIPPTFIAPGTIQDTTGMIYSTNGSMTATGTTQGTAAILARSYNVITSTSLGNTAVKLPVTPTPGLRVVVANFGDRIMTVFPGIGGFIDNGGINGGVSLPLNAIATYQAFSANQWLTVNPPVVAGASITVSYLNGATQVSNTGVTSITGTAGQITASAPTGAVTLSLAANGVTPGTYGGNNTDLTIVIDAEGRISTATTTNSTCCSASNATFSGILGTVNGGTGSGENVTDNKIVVGSGGKIVSSSVDITTLVTMNRTSNSAFTTHGWQGANAHNISAYLTIIGTVVTCTLIDNTGFTQINEANNIQIPALIPVGYRPTSSSAIYMGTTDFPTPAKVAAFYAFAANGDVFISSAFWDGFTYIIERTWTSVPNMALVDGKVFTWTTVL